MALCRPQTAPAPQPPPCRRFVYPTVERLVGAHGEGDPLPAQLLHRLMDLANPLVGARLVRAELTCSAGCPVFWGGLWMATCVVAATTATLQLALRKRRVLLKNYEGRKATIWRAHKRTLQDPGSQPQPAVLAGCSVCAAQASGTQTCGCHGEVMT